MDKFDDDLLHDEIKFILLFDFVLQPIDILVMSNMALLDQLVGGIDHIFMDFDHGRGGVDVVIRAGVVFSRNFFLGVLETQGDEVIKLIWPFYFGRRMLLHLKHGLENNFKLGIMVGDLVINIRIEIRHRFIELFELETAEATLSQSSNMENGSTMFSSDGPVSEVEFSYMSFSAILLT